MEILPAYSILPLGDSACTLYLSDTMDPVTNGQVHALFYHLKVLRTPFIHDLVPAYASLTVCYDIAAVLQVCKPGQSAFSFVQQWLLEMVKNIRITEFLASRRIRVPVCYASFCAPDLDTIATQKQIPSAEVIRLHLEKEYRVYMIGFLPGFAYMGEVDERIAVPRKEQPALRIPAGSVGIADRQTGIYPLDSPGGWQIIGRTPLRLFNDGAAEPVLFQPGDLVTFYSITEDEFKNY